MGTVATGRTGFQRDPVSRAEPREPHLREPHFREHREPPGLKLSTSPAVCPSPALGWGPSPVSILAASVRSPKLGSTSGSFTFAAVFFFSFAHSKQVTQPTVFSLPQGLFQSRKSWKSLALWVCCTSKLLAQWSVRGIFSKGRDSSPSGRGERGGGLEPRGHSYSHLLPCLLL